MSNIADIIEPTETILEGFKEAFITLIWKMRVKKISNYLTIKLLLRGEFEKLKNVLKEMRQNVPFVDQYYSACIKKDVEEVRQMLPRYLDYQISQAICKDYELMATYLIGDKNDWHISATFLSYQTEDITPIICSFLKVYRSIRVGYFFFK